MNALLNAHTPRGCDSPPHIGLTSNVSPEAQSSQTGVSSEYAQQEGHEWFVIRATYNRINAAVEKAKENRIKRALYQITNDDDEVERIYRIAVEQEEY